MHSLRFLPRLASKYCFLASNRKPYTTSVSITVVEKLVYKIIIHNFAKCCLADSLFVCFATFKTTYNRNQG